MWSLKYTINVGDGLGKSVGTLVLIIDGIKVGTNNKKLNNKNKKIVKMRPELGNWVGSPVGKRTT